MQIQLKDINVKDLMLDANNPRFGQLYGGTCEDDIIKYLFEEEDAENLAKKIANDGSFRQDKPLLVLEQDDGTYLVRDGNRRAAAIKALQDPKNKYGLPKTLKIDMVPASVYPKTAEALLDEHIKENHTDQSFKEWSTIAKALEVLRLSKKRVADTELQSIDSDPARLLRIANFYTEAVKIGGDQLRELLRKGGARGGKLTIFERLFSSSSLCGYKFAGKPKNYALEITDPKQFTLYINSIVAYLQANPKTSFKVVDPKSVQPDFLFKTLGLPDITLKPSSGIISGTTKPSAILGGPSGTTPSSGSTPAPASTPVPKPKPLKVTISTKNLFPNLTYIRADTPTNLRDLISECQRISFDIESGVGYPFASMALLRMTFENTLNFILNATKCKSGTLDKIKFMQPKDKLSSKKTTFSSYITNSVIKRQFDMLDLENFNIVIHTGWPTTNKHIVNCAQQVEQLIIWMLQEESAFIAELDKKKL